MINRIMNQIIDNLKMASRPLFQSDYISPPSDKFAKNGRELNKQLKQKNEKQKEKVFNKKDAPQAQDRIV